MADGGAGFIDVGLQIGAMAAAGWGTDLKIGEAIGDYNREMGDISARMVETKREGDRRIGNTKAEGVMSLAEMARENQYQSGLANTQAQMAGSAAQAKLGASGVRAVGSAAFSAGQTADMAQAAADNATAAGNAQVKLGGLRLGTSMQDINAQTTLTTAEYQRRFNEDLFKRRELQGNRVGMVAAAVAGGAGGLANSFYQGGKTAGWWGN